MEAKGVSEGGGGGQGVCGVRECTRDGQQPPQVSGWLNTLGRNEHTQTKTRRSGNVGDSSSSSGSNSDNGSVHDISGITRFGVGATQQGRSGGIRGKGEPFAGGREVD